MLKLHYSKERTVLWGVTLHCDGSGAPLYTPRGDIDAWDPFQNLFRNYGFVLPIGFRSYAGIYDPRVSVPAEVVRFSDKPTDFKYANSGNYDSNSYGSVLGGVLHAIGGVLTHETVSFNASVSHEHFTRHRSLTGDGACSFISVFRTYRDFDLYGTLIRIPDSVDSYIYRSTVVASNPLDLTPITDHVSGNNSLNALPILEFCSRNGLSAVFGGGVISTLSGFEYTISDSVDIRYHLSFVNPGAGDSADVDIHLRFPLGMDGTPDPMVVGSVVHTVTSSGAICHYSNWQNPVFPVFNGESGSFASGESGLSYGLILGYSPLPVGTEEALAIVATERIAASRELNSFADAVDRSFGDLYASAYFSSTAAIESVRSQFSTTTARLIARLLNLSKQQSDIVASLPGLIQHFGKDLAKLPLRQLQHVLSSGFPGPASIRITSALLSSWIEEFLAVSYLAGVQIPPVIGHGSFHHTFSNEFGRDEVRLVVHTKIVVRSDFQSLAIALLGSDTGAILSRILTSSADVPLFSLISGMLGIAQAQVRMFDTLFFSAIPATYIHSYSFVSDLSDTELANWNLASTGLEPISLKHFMRDVSLFSPAPRSTKFDFGVPSVSLDTVASILLRTVLANIQGY